MTIWHDNKRDIDMARTLDEVIGSLPPDQQRDIEARAGQLIEEEMTLRDLRKAHELTQTRMSELSVTRKERDAKL